jgi:hypothetical protein
MKSILSVHLLLTICLIGFSFVSNAQNSQDTIKSQIETVDGNQYIGIIIEQTAATIRIKTDKLGEISIPIKEIKRITQLTSIKSKDGTYWLENPQSTRYLWAPNGYSLKKGEGYYQNVWVLFNQAVYGITDHLTAGVGVVPLFLFAGTSTPAWITLKYSIPVVKNKINLAAGALMGTIIGEQGSAGILYGMGTFGSRDKNINIGLGWGIGNGQITSTPVINISGMIRTGANGYLITENYFVINSGDFVVLTMIGGRRIIRHFGLDFGLFMPLGPGMNGFFAAPWLGFTVPFGTKSTSINK